MQWCTLTPIDQKEADDEPPCDRADNQDGGKRDGQDDGHDPSQSARKSGGIPAARIVAAQETSSDISPNGIRP